VVRADDMSKVKTALCDLVRYAHLTFEGKARTLEPTFADNILVHVMRSPLKSCCEAASIVPLEDEASAAIGRVKKIHPPAHIIIVSPRHEIFYELINFVDILPEIELTFREKTFEDDDTKTSEDNKASIFKDSKTMMEDIRKKIEDNKKQIEINNRKIESKDDKIKIKTEENMTRTEDNKAKMLGSNKTKISEEKYDKQKFR